MGQSETGMTEQTNASTDLDVWPGGLVVDHCPRGSATMSKPETFSKTMFRPELFSAFSDHMPKAPLREGIVNRFPADAELAALQDAAIAAIAHKMKRLEAHG